MEKFEILFEDGVDSREYIESNYGSYPEQMPIYLTIDLDREIPAVDIETYNFRQGMPRDIFNGTKLAFELPPNVDASLMYRFVDDDIREDIEAIIDGSKIVWSGSNYVTEFEEHARRIIEQYRCCTVNFPTFEFGGIMNPEDYFTTSLSMPDKDDPVARLDGYNNITSNTTDEEIIELAKEIMDEIDNCGYPVVISGSMEDFLTELREECIRLED